MDLDEIKTNSDLVALKKKDPFMFYSIPTVLKTVMEGKRVELPTIHKAIAKESMVLKRSRRISFESIDKGMSMLLGLQTSGDGPQHAYETDTIMMMTNLNLSTRILSLLMHFLMNI